MSEQTDVAKTGEVSQSDEVNGYIPFGNEWIKEMKKMTKTELIQMVRRIKESPACALYVNYKASCQALKDKNKELGI